MKAEELKNILALHVQWLCSNHKEGQRADLSDADLSDADLSDADLHGATLSRAILSGADLRSAILSGADLRGADLRDAILSHAILRSAILSGADLRGAIGNLSQIKTLQTDIWTITYTDEVIAIGCQQHSKQEWLNFNDDQIERMDAESSLAFWKKWKPILKAIGVFDKTGMEI